MNKPRTQSPQVELLNLATGHWRSQALHVAAELGIADLLRGGPKSIAEIASSLEVDAGALHRLLRALASLDVFAEREDGRFELTPVAELLRTDRPDSMRDFARTLGGATYQAWAGALQSVKTGKPVFEQTHGVTFFEYLRQHEDASKIFDASMTAQSRIAHSSLVSSYDFGPFQRIIDVGGGQGTLLELILRTNPTARGVLFDQPQVIQLAQERFAASTVAPRCELVAGSFFESVPAGGDLYMMAMVIHDWDDADAQTILRNCFNAMRPGAKLVLSELIIPSGNAPFFGKLLDLDMLINLGGKERTEKEYRALLISAGFTDMRVLPSYGSALSIIEAVRS